MREAAARGEYAPLHCHLLALGAERELHTSLRCDRGDPRFSPAELGAPIPSLVGQSEQQHRSQPGNCLACGGMANPRRRPRSGNADLRARGRCAASAGGILDRGDSASSRPRPLAPGVHRGPRTDIRRPVSVGVRRYQRPRLGPLYDRAPSCGFARERRSRRRRTSLHESTSLARVSGDRDPAADVVDALEDVRRLVSSFEILEDGPRVTDMLAMLCREVPIAGRQVHDANVAVNGAC